MSAVRYYILGNAVAVSLFIYFKYLLTPSVRKNLCDIARCVSLSNHPVLIQGETSVGKTSLITYLANSAGHKCYRINNHQHTDLQEYVGTYAADPVTGSLVFREGEFVLLSVAYLNGFDTNIQ